jgi:hypothetical protein
MVGLRMSWARPLLGFSIVFFIIAMPTKFFHGVDLIVIIASTLALEVVTAIAVLISIVAPITIVVMAVPNVTATSKVVTAVVVAVVVVSWRVRCFVGALIQQLLGVVGICILLSGAEEVDHRYRPFTKDLVPEIVVVAQPVMKASIASLSVILGILMLISEKRRMYSRNGSSLALWMRCRSYLLPGYS